MNLRSLVKGIQERVFERSEAGIVIRGSVAVAGVQALGMATAYGAHIYLARQLGAQEYGVFSVGWNWLSYLGRLAALGLPLFALRQFASHEEAGEPGRAKGSVLFSSMAVVGLGLAVSGVTLLLLDFGLFPVRIEYVAALRTSLLVIIPLALLQLWVSVGRSVGHAGLAYLPQTVLVPLTLALTWAVVARFGAEGGASILQALPLPLVALALLHPALLWRTVPPSVRRAPVRWTLGPWAVAAFSLSVLTTLRLTQSRLDTLVIGVFLDPVDSALFNSAKRTAILVAAFLTAQNALIAPQISRLHTRGDPDAIQAMVRRVMPFIVGPAFLVALGVLIFRGLILSAFGPDFVNAGGILFVLTLGQFANAAFGPCMFLLTMTGNQNHVTRVLIFTVIVQLGLSISLIPSMGAMGAALATFLTMVFWNVAIWWIALRVTGVDASAFCLLKPEPGAER